jgi:hypothetical protein
LERVRAFIETLPFRGGTTSAEGNITAAFLALKQCQWQSPLRCLCVISDSDDDHGTSVTQVNDIADKISELGVDLIIARLHPNALSQLASLKLEHKCAASVSVSIVLPCIHDLPRDPNRSRRSWGRLHRMLRCTISSVMTNRHKAT